MIDILNFPKEILYTNYNAGSFKHVAQLMYALNLNPNDTTVTIKNEDNEHSFPKTVEIILSGKGWLLHLKFKEVSMPEYWQMHAEYKYKCVYAMIEQSFR